MKELRRHIEKIETVLKNCISNKKTFFRLLSLKANTINLTALRKHQYPEIVYDQLDKIFSTVLSVLGQRDIYSILLLGSAARGELSYELTTNGINLV